MDRIQVYPGQVPLETDILNTNKYAMVGLSKLAEVVMGQTPILIGFPCVPASGMAVSIGAGQVYNMAPIDATAYSSLVADNVHSVLKQGVLLDPLTLNCPSPATSGQSINYLVQIGYQENDINSVNLPFYNAANPSVPFAGANNNGIPLNTTRSGQCIVQIKAGSAAATGAQTAPSADTGFIGAYVVTATYGAGTIAISNIIVVANAPFLSLTLPLIQAQKSFALPALAPGSVFKSDGTNYFFDTPDGDCSYLTSDGLLALFSNNDINSINGPINATLPANPNRKDYLWLTDSGWAGTNTVTVKRPGTNYLSFPEDISNAGWSKFNTSATNNTTLAPNGLNTAASIIANTTNISHSLYQSYNLIANNYYTFSFFIKAGTKSKCALSFSNGGLTYSFTFNLVGNGSIGTAISTLAYKNSITLIGNGWYRVSITQAFPSAGTTSLSLYPLDPTYQTVYAGDGVSADLYIWGGKLDLNSSASFYDPVTPSQNLFLYSAPTLSGVWSATNSTVIDNAAIAPDGSLTGSSISETNSVNTLHSMGYSLTPLNNTPYTFSVDVAAVGRSWVFIQLNFGGVFAQVYFDVINGVIGAIDARTGAATISKTATNGYWRISVTSTPTISTASGALSIYTSTGNNLTTYTGDSRLAINVANVQLETGSISTPRIYTNGTQATRTGNPHRIMGLQEDMTLTSSYAAFRLAFVDDFRGWVIK